MPKQNLIFNILTFDWPENTTTFYFSTEDNGKCRRIHRSLFPKDIETIFPSIKSVKPEFIYTSFKGETDGFKPLKIDFRQENPNLIKCFYNRQINYYFRSILGKIVKTGFISENQIWIYSEKQSTIQWDIYERFSLKVQIKTVSKFPEIVLSYDGKSKVLKRNIADLLDDVSPIKFNWVIHNRKLRKYEFLADGDFDDYENTFPVLNYGLKLALKYPMTPPKKGNRYKNYLDLIKRFYYRFLNNNTFRELISINCVPFLRVPKGKINYTVKNSNQLIFGNNKVDIVPNTGMRINGPFKTSRWNKVHLFYIMHKDSVQVAKTLDSYFKNGLKYFSGLKQFAHVYAYTEPGFSVVFSNKENPIPEIEKTLSDRDINPDVKYIAIYLTPYSRFEKDISKREIYYHVKELLLKRNITSQAIEAAKIIKSGISFYYSLPNIAVAILAKLDGVPWRLNTPIKNELIVGVGAFRHISTDVQYIGSAFSFDNKGGFNQFEYFMKNETDILAGSISSALREYTALNSTIDRLIIHFYKNMSKKELAPIEQALTDLGLEIPVFIVSISKTESRDIVAFDLNWDDLMPNSGTYVNIGENKYLLFNNTRYSTNNFNMNDGYPFPIKLNIACTEVDKLQDIQVIKDLINQVYQFSRMYWKSVRQQNLPITIKYPEMVARIAPHFKGDEIPQFGKDNLWFL